METIVKSIISALMFWVIMWVGMSIGMSRDELVMLGLALIYVVVVNDKL